MKKALFPWHSLTIADSTVKQHWDLEADMHMQNLCSGKTDGESPQLPPLLDLEVQPKQEIMAKVRLSTTGMLTVTQHAHTQVHTEPAGNGARALCLPPLARFAFWSI